MSDVVFYVTLGLISYTLFDLGNALASIITAKPWACMFFGAIDLLCGAVLSQMVRGELFPEFLSYISQSNFNFIPVLWGLVVLTFASAALFMLRAAHLIFRCDIY